MPDYNARFAVPAAEEGSAFIPYAAGRPLGDILCIQESRSGGRRFCKRAEDPLHAAARLGRIGRDMLDAELLEGAPDLGRLRPRHLPAGLGGHEIMDAAVGIERAEQPLPADHLGQAEQARERPFLLDQKGGVELAGRIIEGHDQVELMVERADPAMGGSATFTEIQTAQI